MISEREHDPGDPSQNKKRRQKVGVQTGFWSASGAGVPIAASKASIDSLALAQGGSSGGRHWQWAPAAGGLLWGGEQTRVVAATTKS